jgi:hypothetical protein
MKGRYDKSEAQIAQLSGEVANLQRLLSTVSAPPPPPPAATDVRFVTADEQREFGDEFLGVVGKRAKEIVSPEVAQLRAEIAQLKSQIGGVSNAVVMDARQKMFSELDAALPQWREINKNSEFLSWLRLTDIYSGVIRHELLTKAFNAHQTSRVLAFFRGFLADEAATSPATGRQPASDARGSPTLDLATVAAPGRARRAATEPSAPSDQKPTFTRAQIAKFYREVAEGRYAGRDADKIEMEKAIFEAGREGRVRN